MEYLLPRELDAKIAELVMKWSNVHFDDDWENWTGFNQNDYWTVPDYSTNIQDAWRVIEAMERGHDIQLTCEGGYYTVDVRGGNEFFRAQAYSIEKAICLVALKAFA